MASVRYGGGVADARGAHGGTVLSRNRSGAIMMVRTAGCNPRTSLQSGFRTILPLLSQAWNETLSDAQRVSWNTFASTQPVLNRLGVTTTLSGAQWFARANGLIVKQGFPLIANPPGSTAVNTPTSIFMTPDSVSGTFHFQPNATGVAANEHAAIFASPPMNKGRHYVSSKLRFIAFGTINFNNDITTAYKSIFGFFPTTAGQKIFGRFYIVNSATGISSAAIQAHAYIT